MSVFFEFLNSKRLAVLSTQGDSGPQSALIGIAVTPNLEILFDTTEATRKFANLSRNPACALVAGWEDEQSLQYEGRARRIDSRAENPELAPYFAAFPDGIERLNWTGICHFAIAPAWIRFSDFARTPPRIETWPS